MMDKTNKNINIISNRAVLGLLGKFIKNNRVIQNKTQQQVAVAAGINRSTLVQIENGKGANMLSFIQVLRAIDQLGLLAAFETSPQFSPIELAKLQMKKRQRASTKKMLLKPKQKSNW